jgi:adenylate kinase family enzyme
MVSIDNRMKIVICGKMCSGKTTLAQTIQRMDSRYTIHSIGQKVKDLATDVFQMKGKDRDLLIAIGTQMREIDPDVWVKHIISQTQGETHCIVDDMRYQNEYDILRQHGFIVIQLHISRDIQEQRIKKLYTGNSQEHLKNRGHLSERNLFEWYSGSEPVLTIDNAEDQDKVMQRIHSFLQKQENKEYS